MQQVCFITLFTSTREKAAGGSSSDDTAWDLLNTNLKGAIFKGSEGIP
jgi:hypothetical protein